MTARALINVPRKAKRGELAVEIRIAIFLIARDRMARVRRVHTNLMRATRVQADLHQSRALAKELQRMKFG